MYNIEKLMDDTFTKAYEEFMIWWKGRKQFREVITKHITKKMYSIRLLQLVFLLWLILWIVIMSFR